MEFRNNQIASDIKRTSMGKGSKLKVNTRDYYLTWKNNFRKAMISSDQNNFQISLQLYKL